MDTFDYVVASHLDSRQRELSDKIDNLSAEVERQAYNSSVAAAKRRQQQEIKHNQHLASIKNQNAEDLMILTEQISELENLAMVLNNRWITSNAMLRAVETETIREKKPESLKSDIPCLNSGQISMPTNFDELVELLYHCALMDDFFRVMKMEAELLVKNGDYESTNEIVFYNKKFSEWEAACIVWANAWREAQKLFPNDCKDKLWIARRKLMKDNGTII